MLAYRRHRRAILSTARNNTDVDSRDDSRLLSTVDAPLRLLFLCNNHRKPLRYVCRQGAHRQYFSRNDSTIPYSFINSTSFSFRLKLFKRPTTRAKSRVLFRNVSTLAQVSIASRNEGKLIRASRLVLKLPQFLRVALLMARSEKISKSTSCRTTYVAFSVRLHPDKAKFATR